jgi:hypothetical protein
VTGQAAAVPGQAAAAGGVHLFIAVRAPSHEGMHFHQPELVVPHQPSSTRLDQGAAWGEGARVVAPLPFLPSPPPTTATPNAMWAGVGCSRGLHSSPWGHANAQQAVSQPPPTIGSWCRDRDVGFRACCGTRCEAAATGPSTFIIDSRPALAWVAHLTSRLSCCYSKDLHTPSAPSATSGTNKVGTCWCV